MALRAGLRRANSLPCSGETSSSKDEQDRIGFIVVEHNYVSESTPRRRARKASCGYVTRAEASPDRASRQASLGIFLKRKEYISDELGFLASRVGFWIPTTSTTATFGRYSGAAAPEIRLHDLRHTFGSLLIQSELIV